MVWFVAGIVTGIAVTLLALPLWRAGVSNSPGPAVRYTLALGAIVLLGSSVLIVSLRSGGSGPEVAAVPHAVTQPVMAAQPSLPTDLLPMATTTTRSAPSMESAAAGLAERLHKNGGSRADWLLLARSYDFMGRTAEANDARARAEAADK